MKNRYLKQELCSFIGSEGQERIRDKHVLIMVLVRLAVPAQRC